MAHILEESHKGTLSQKKPLTCIKFNVFFSTWRRSNTSFSIKAPTTPVELFSFNPCLGPGIDLGHSKQSIANFHADLNKHTARLIVQLQLQHIIEVSSHGTPEHDDFAFAVALYKADLKAMNNRPMAQRNAHGNPAGVEIIKEPLLEEQQAPGHRRGGPLQANDQDAPVLPIKMISAAFTDDDGIDDNDSTPGYAPTRPVAKHECCACAEEFTFDAVARVPCGHHYCQNCLKHLFTLSLTQETLFPPRCCRRAMDAKHYPLLLPLRLLRDFQTRMVELTTDDRTYCHVPGCGKFILPQNIQHQVGRCVACDGRTCSVCKNAAHVGDCPEDLAVKALESLAAQNGWRRCNDCRRIVELTDGCNHISKLMPLHKLPLDQQPAAVVFNSATSVAKSGRPALVLSIPKTSSSSTSTCFLQPGPLMPADRSILHDLVGGIGQTTGVTLISSGRWF